MTEQRQSIAAALPPIVADYPVAYPVPDPDTIAMDTDKVYRFDRTALKFYGEAHIIVGPPITHYDLNVTKQSIDRNGTIQISTKNIRGVLTNFIA